MKRSPMKRGTVAKFLRGEIGLTTPKIQKAVRKAMKRGTKGLARTAWKRKRTERATLKAAMVKAALDLYFKAEDPWNPPTCQACGKILTRPGAQAHHKKRASARGVDSPSNLLAVHPLCHAWIHAGGSRGPAETAARESTASIANGETVAWPADLRQKLEHYLHGGTPAWKR